MADIDTNTENETELVPKFNQAMNLYSMEEASVSQELLDTSIETEPFPEFDEAVNREFDPVPKHCVVHCTDLRCIRLTQRLGSQAFKEAPCLCRGDPNGVWKPRRAKLDLQDAPMDQLPAWNHYGETKYLYLFKDEVREIVGFLDDRIADTILDDAKFLEKMEQAYPGRLDAEGNVAMNLFFNEIYYFFNRRFRNRDFMTMSINAIRNCLRHIIKVVMETWGERHRDETFKSLCQLKVDNFPSATDNLGAILAQFWKKCMEDLIGLLAWRNHEILDRCSRQFEADR